MPKHAAILAIGDELTLGQNLDSNSQWLAARLAEHSWLTTEHRTIADDREAIAAAIRELAARNALLIMSGGLGPTDDDLTRLSLGDVMTPGESLETDDHHVRLLKGWFARTGRPMPPANAVQAMRPRTAQLLDNPHGTAPGITGEIGGCVVYALPGPPREMQPMFEHFVLPTLKASDVDSVIRTALVHACGIGESDAAQRLGDLTSRTRNPLIGTTASGGVVTARIRASGAPGTVDRTLAADVQCVRALWHPYAFGIGPTTVANALGAELVSRGVTLATAESCTGGLIGKLLVDPPGSSAYYVGGFVTYSNAMKQVVLDVPERMLRRYGAVAEEVARAMALGAMAKSGARSAIAVTGIAGPEGGTAEKPVGTVWIAAAVGEHDEAVVDVRRFHIKADRSAIRERSALMAMQMLRLLLRGEAEGTRLLWQIQHTDAAEEVTT